MATTTTYAQLPVIISGSVDANQDLLSIVSNGGTTQYSITPQQLLGAVTASIYRTYVARLENYMPGFNPTPTVFENTLGYDLSWVLASNPGRFTTVLSGSVLPSGSTWVVASCATNSTASFISHSATLVDIQYRAESGSGEWNIDYSTYSGSILTNTHSINLEIRVYN